MAIIAGDSRLGVGRDGGQMRAASRYPSGGLENKSSQAHRRQRHAMTFTDQLTAICQGLLERQ